MVESDEATWTSVETVALTTVFRRLELLNDSGVSLLSLDDESIIRSISLTQGFFEINFEAPKIKLDQLYNSRVRFKMIGSNEDLPSEIHIKSTDPNVSLDQTLILKWEGQDMQNMQNMVPFKDGLTGLRLFFPENKTELSPLKVAFPNRDDNSTKGRNQP